MRKSLLILALALLLSGCGLRPAESGVTEAPAELGYRFRFTNATGQNICAIAFREASTGEDYTENLLSPGFVLHDGEWMELCYDNSEAEKAFQALQTGSEGPVLTSEYRMLLVLQDGRHYELSAFPLGDMEACTVLLSENVAWLSYTSMCTQQLILTKEAELAIYEKWGRQARDISALVTQLPAEPVPTAAVESTPAPEIPEADEGEEAVDPNEGCLTGGLFY